MMFSRGHLHALRERVRLTDDERAHLRARLEAFTATHPVRVRTEEAPRLLSQWLAFRWPMRLSPMPALIVVALIALSGGVSLAAERALPGGTLYPVKVEVNERVRGAFAVTHAAEAHLQVDLAARRITEAEALAIVDRLDAETRAELLAGFEVRVANAQTHIDALTERGRADDAATANAELEATLGAHSALLEVLAEDRPATVEVIAPVTMRVDAHAEEAADARAAIESHARVALAERARARSAAEARLRAAETAIARSQELLGELRSAAQADVTTNANAQLALAGDALARGRAHLAANAYGDAFVTFQDAFRIAKELDVFLTSHQALDLPGIMDDASKPQASEDRAGEDRAEANFRAERQAAVAAQLERAEAALAEVRAEFDRNRARLDASGVVDVQAKLDAAAAAISRGRERLAEQVMDAARAFSDEALSITANVKLFLSANVRAPDALPLLNAAPVIVPVEVRADASAEARARAERERREVSSEERVGGVPDVQVSR